MHFAFALNYLHLECDGLSMNYLFQFFTVSVQSGSHKTTIHNHCFVEILNKVKTQVGSEKVAPLGDPFCLEMLYDCASDKLRNMFYELHEYQIECRDLLKASSCKMFPGLLHEIRQFDNVLAEYKLYLQDRLSKILYNVIVGRDPETVFTSIFTKRNESPFSTAALATWLKEKNNEAKMARMLETIVTEMGGIRFEADLQTALMNSKKKHVLCFTVLRSKTDPHLDAMKAYLGDSKKEENAYRGTCHLKSNDEAMNTLVKNKKIFKSMFNDRHSFPAAEFVITAVETDFARLGGFIYYYKEGELFESDFQPPSEPINLVTDTKHDSVTMKWKKPYDRAYSVTEYEIQISKRSHRSYNIPFRRTSKSETCTVSGLMPGTNYEIKVRACSIAARSKFETKFISTLPAGPPGKPFLSQVSISKAHLRWSKPRVIAKHANILSYTILVNTGESETWNDMKEVNGESTKSVMEIFPNECHRFKVRANCLGQPGDCTTGEASEASEEFYNDQLKTTIVKAGMPSVHQIRSEITYRRDNICKRILGPINRRGVPEKVIMLIGETGTGKTTLINGMINYVMDVDFNEELRLKLTQENGEGEETLRAERHIKTITSYTIHHREGFAVPYTLTIVDTPGIESHEAIFGDPEITEDIATLFRTPGEGGVDHIDAVCFVVKSSSQPHFTHNQQNLFKSVIKLFGEGIANNIFFWETFADIETTRLRECIENAELPHRDCLKFNSQALFADLRRHPEFDFENEILWDMNSESYKLFFMEHITNSKEISLLLSSRALQQRKALEISIQGIQKDIKRLLEKCERLRTEREVLTQHRMNIDQNQNFEYEVRERSTKKSPIEKGTHSFNCINCKCTCHYPCKGQRNTLLFKYLCSSMSMFAFCIVCPNRCSLFRHEFTSESKYDDYITTQIKTFYELKERYGLSSKKTLSASDIIKKVEDELKTVVKDIVKLVKRAKSATEEIDKISKKRKIEQTIFEYIDSLIAALQTEAQPGSKGHLNQLYFVRKAHEYEIDEHFDWEECETVF